MVLHASFLGDASLSHPLGVFFAFLLTFSVVLLTLCLTKVPDFRGEWNRTISNHSPASLRIIHDFVTDGDLAARPIPPVTNIERIRLELLSWHDAVVAWEWNVRTEDLPHFEVSLSPSFGRPEAIVTVERVVYLFRLRPGSMYHVSIKARVFTAGRPLESSPKGISFRTPRRGLLLRSFDVVFRRSRMRAHQSIFDVSHSRLSEFTASFQDSWTSFQKQG